MKRKKSQRVATMSDEESQVEVSTIVLNNLPPCASSLFLTEPALDIKSGLILCIIKPTKWIGNFRSQNREQKEK